MSNPLLIRSSVTIDAPALKVWDALVNPVQTKKYMYGCEALSDWKPGSPLIWKGIFDGVELIAVKGDIVAIEPGKYLAYTVIDPNNNDIPDLPENYLTVTYHLESINDQTTLTVTQGDYSKVAEGQKRYQHAVDGGGWESIVAEIKRIVETA